MSLIGLVLFTAAGVGVLIYRNLESALFSPDLNALSVTARTLAATVETYAGSARSDVRVVRALPQVDAFVRARRSGGTDPQTGLSEAAMGEWVEDALVALMRTHPEYLQFRLIGGLHGGRELVRVDRARAGEVPRVVSEGQLQSVEDRSYFAETTRLGSGGLYVSPVELMQRQGVVQTPHVPVLHVSTPVVIGDDMLAFVIVTVDMTPLLDGIRNAAPPSGRVLLVNQSGEFLGHPDREREFGSQVGHMAVFSDEYSDVPLFGDQDMALTTGPGGRPDALGIASASLAGGPMVAVVVSLPRQKLGLVADTVRRSSTIAGAIATLVAIMLAVVIARSVSRPLARMSRVVKRMNAGEHSSLPVEAAGEVGELARAFERFAQREALFGAVFESIDEAIVTVDLAGNITGWNPAAERLYGYRAEEAVGQAVGLIVPDQQREELDSIMHNVRDGRSVRDVETVRKAKDGRLIDVSLTASPIRTLSGAIVGSSAAARDITDSKLAEDQFRLAVEAAPTGMILVDDKAVIRLMNSESERLFGYDRSELLGKPIEVLIPEQYRHQHKKDRDGYIDGPQSRAMGAGRNLFGLRKDGSRFPVEIGLNPITSREGRFILSAVVDISERKRSEAVILARTRELERSNAELEQFAYVASHDLREPLRMVSNYTELLADKYHGQIDEKADKYIHYAVDGAQRMQQLIDDLLAYSRVGTQGKALRAVDANLVLKRVLRTLGVAIAEAGAKVEAEPLPTVEADEVQLAQVLQNLIGNAFKFRSSEAPHIRIGADCTGTECTFRVADNGIGIEMQHADRIFQMFQRLQERGIYPGSGIGLAITRKIVERHGGTIWFDSQPGRGSTFYFSMNLARKVLVS